MAKCALEHVRPASTLEQISLETWRDAIEESVEAALRDLTDQGAEAREGALVPGDDVRPAAPTESTAPAAPLTDAELAAAIQPVLAGAAPSQQMSRADPVC